MWGFRRLRYEWSSGERRFQYSGGDSGGQRSPIKKREPRMPQLPDDRVEAAARTQLRSKKILRPPQHMPQDRSGALRPQHERAEILVERKKSDRRRQQRDQPHPAIRHSRNEQHARQPHPIAAPGRPAARQVLKKAPRHMIGNPAARVRRKFGDHVQRQLGKQRRHAVYQLAIQIVRSGSERNLDVFSQINESVENGSSPSTN